MYSFEKELDAQYAKVVALSKKLGQRRLSCNGTETDEVHHLKKAVESAKSQLDACVNEKASLSAELGKVREALHVSQTQHAEAMDHLALKIAQQNLTQSNDETSRMLSDLQKIWAEVGLPMNQRQVVRERLKNCVEDACSNMLAEASRLRDDKREEVEKLQSKLQAMHALLGTMDSYSSITSVSQSIEDQTKALNYCINEIRHEFENALARCKALITSTNALVSELNLDENAISPNLKQLLLHGKQLLKSSSSSASSEPILCDSFLDSCEKEIKKLKLLKSDRLLSTVDLFNKLRSIAAEMDASPKELTSMALYCIKRRSYLPEWWSSRVWEQVEGAFSKQGSDQTATEAFIAHLKLLVDTTESITHGRRLLSDALKAVVDESHEVILATAEGCEMDVMDLYQSLQDTLSRLPPLSKQHVKGCLDEMKMFTAAAESIAQSEIETLTVSTLLNT